MKLSEYQKKGISKPDFDWERFKSHKIAIVCRTEAGFEDFQTEAFMNDLRWSAGKQYLTKTYDIQYISTDEGNYMTYSSSDTPWYQLHDYIFIEWSDYYEA